MIDITPQLALRPELSTVIGNIDYTRFAAELARIEELLVMSGVEREFIERSAIQFIARGVTAGTAVNNMLLGRYKARSVVALRSMILMGILGEDFRGMSCRLAECQLFRHFCGLECLGPIRVPSKSTLQEYSQWLPKEEMREVIGKLLRAAGEGKSALELANDLELDRGLIDTTCVRANMHFPVDWVLLRDAVRTLMKATALIRKHGLKSRMEEPQEFLKAMNRLCIEMTSRRRAKDAKRLRKQTLRRMKKVVKVVEAHAQRHRDLLDKEWASTDWTRKQAEAVLRRIDGVLELLPCAQKQAHERIIGERQVKNSEKILSLYEREAHVIVRGKAGAEVEFGNTVLLVEQVDGLLIDWEFYGEQAPADSELLQASVKRTEKSTGKLLKAAGTDRGFDSPENVTFLEEKGIFNGMCPRSPRVLRERMSDPVFAAIQKRRASTEARIGIFKNVFLGRPMRAKGALHRELAVAWRVLAHNLWVLARLPKAQEQQILLAA